LTTWIFSGRIKAGPLKCTDPTVGGQEEWKERRRERGGHRFWIEEDDS